MSVINSDSMRAGASGAVSGYTIDQSCRFNDDDSAHWTQTLTGASRRIGTISQWIKRGSALASTVHLWDATDSNSSRCRFNSPSGVLDVFFENAAGTKLIQRITTQVFRDPSAWFHLVIGWDSNQTDNTCIAIEVNGVAITSFTTTTNPGSAGDTIFGQTTNTTKFFAEASISGEFDGYIAEFAYIDGSKLAASNFGETDDQGNWVPIDISGLTFGSAGCYQDMAVAPGTGNGAGTDVSGNGNHFTDSGLAANDQVKDSPTDDADNDVGNKMVFLPFFPSDDAAGTIHFTEGNTQFLDDYSPNSENGICRGSMWFETGKWYWEIEITGTPATVDTMVGVGSPPITSNGLGGNIVAYRADGAKVIDATWTGGYGNTYTNGDKIGVALDMDSYDVEFFDNGVSQGVLSLTGTIADGGWSVWSQRNGASTLFQFRLLTDPADWAGSAPTGFVAPCTANFPAPTITDPSKYFQVDTYTGTGSELQRPLSDTSGAIMTPDLVWIKDRDTSVEHVLTDSVRGATKEWNSDSSNAETTVAQGLKSFDTGSTGGFTLGTDGNYNTSSSLNVAWCWVEGATPGMDIVSYTGDGTSSRNISHSVGAVPEFMIVKNLIASGTYDVGAVYHASATSPEHYGFELATVSTGYNDAGIWSDTNPTSSVFTVGGNDQVNGSGNACIAYLWAGVEGYSKFGSYEGNGNADGTFVYCGFRPAWIMCKSIDSTSSWYIYDHKRDGYNADNDALLADTTTAELTADNIDILSNGFKLRIATDPNVSETYIYLAWAEFPFGGDGVSQARAR